MTAKWRVGVESRVMTSQVTWLAPGVRGAAVAGVITWAISCGVILVFVIDTNSDGERKLELGSAAKQNSLLHDDTGFNAILQDPLLQFSEQKMNIFDFTYLGRKEIYT